MTERPSQEKSLAELTGHAIDPGAYLVSRQPLLESRGWDLHTYAERLLVMKAPLIAKVLKHGERTPVAPHLPEIEARLKRMLEFYGEDSPAPAHRILEPLAYLEHDIDEAERYFHG